MTHKETDKIKRMWRRFRIKDKTKEQALMELIQHKGLSHEDLKLILSTLELSSDRNA